MVLSDGDLLVIDKALEEEELREKIPLLWRGGRRNLTG